MTSTYYNLQLLWPPATVTSSLSWPQGCSVTQVSSWWPVASHSSPCPSHWNIQYLETLYWNVILKCCIEMLYFEIILIETKFLHWSSVLLFVVVETKTSRLPPTPQLALQSSRGTTLITGNTQQNLKKIFQKNKQSVEHTNSFCMENY